MFGQWYSGIDAETIKTAVSILSALIALFSFWLTIATRRNTRREAFEDRKEVVAATMTDNEYRLDSMKLRIVMLKKKLHSLMANAPPHLEADAKSSIEHLAIIEEQLDAVPRAVQGSDIHSLVYSGKSALALKAIKHAADDMSANLKQDGWLHVFADADSVVQKLEDHRMASLRAQPAPSGP